jgi:hypothetical protein
MGDMTIYDWVLRMEEHKSRGDTIFRAANDPVRKEREVAG